MLWIHLRRITSLAIFMMIVLIALLWIDTHLSTITQLVNRVDIYVWNRDNVPVVSDQHQPTPQRRGRSL